ncbi:MAG TPA: GNAT family N-acetyltransferase [Blastocatellia bacterium]|nr:GNAT family N-acetyltransferase [Blastocatellia bacterium]
MDLEVTLALPEQEPILANMLELYVHDFSEFIDVELGPDGRFGYKRLPLYWRESNRYPFLIMADGHLAGFAFVCRGSGIAGDADVWDMAEFFIARGFRRRGLGMKVAQTIWEKFPGKWEVRVLDRNQKAMEFWRRATNRFLGKTIEPIPFNKDGIGWHVFSFESGSAGRFQEYS